MMLTKLSQPRVADFRNSPASGTRTSRLSHSTVRPSVIPKPGITLGSALKGMRDRVVTGVNRPSVGRLVDAVEGAALAEMLGLRLGPAAELLVDGEEGHLREDVGMLRRDLGVARAIVVLRRDLLAFLAVEEAQIGLGRLAAAALVDHLVDDCNRRFGQDRHARHHDLELVLAELVDGQEGLVLPAQEDVADISLHEGDGGAARPGIEYGYVAVELLHIIAGGIAAASGLAFGIAPS